MHWIEVFTPLMKANDERDHVRGEVGPVFPFLLDVVYHTFVGRDDTLQLVSCDRGYDLVAGIENDDK